ncbi:helix-turn-helix domain-containing protein [Actinokineospora sp. G85]|uniref:helix-turn-helix domain-containing protein n=1 Tax=Actinokineospora sp. G85 TaxID=3406626 RepID=UPI003C71E1E9
MTTMRQPTMAHRGLGGELRLLRESRKLSCKKVADQLGWQASKISRMETGKQGISTADLASMLVVYGVVGKERDRLLKMAERTDDLGYWETQPALSNESKMLLRIEREATSIVDFEPLLVPGLAQTGDYVRAVMTATGVPAADIDSRVSARMARQAILNRSEPPTCRMLLDEYVLRRVIGTPKIMARQLRHLLEMIEKPTTTLQVLPMALRGHPGLDGPFLLLDFEQQQPVVYLDHKVSGLFLEEPDQVALFRDVTDKLSAVALSQTKSADLVATIAQEHDRE